MNPEWLWLAIPLVMWLLAWPFLAWNARRVRRNTERCLREMVEGIENGTIRLPDGSPGRSIDD